MERLYHVASVQKSPQGIHAERAYFIAAVQKSLSACSWLRERPGLFRQVLHRRNAGVAVRAYFVAAMRKSPQDIHAECSYFVAPLQKSLSACGWFRESLGCSVRGSSVSRAYFIAVVFVCCVCICVCFHVGIFGIPPLGGAVFITHDISCQSATSERTAEAPLRILACPPAKRGNEGRRSRRGHSFQYEDWSG
jgi:hypothetical protein